MNKKWVILRGSKIKVSNNFCENQNEMKHTSERRYTKQNKSMKNIQVGYL
jgi:hypothetical protein